MPATHEWRLKIESSVDWAEDQRWCDGVVMEGGRSDRKKNINVFRIIFMKRRKYIFRLLGIA